MVRIYQTNKSNYIPLINISHKFAKSEPIDDNHVVTKSYVDSLSKKDRTRCDFSIVMNDQDSDFNEEKLSKLDSITLNRNPILEEEAVKKLFGMI